uniref:Uncharacterized protein n=1 Tax=Oryza sativa subsp. japonica TaxID=39947 RepID=Q6ZLN4_ORYSJ|nr:hypothetical protein [Oryza sativa Japonica Group]BAD31955.1 hypothetical protein [Oryza sativa Japonica Group]
MESGRGRRVCSRRLGARIKGELKRNQWGLKPLINFGISQMNQADLREEMARVHGGERRRPGRRRTTTWHVGPTRARGQRTHVRGTGGRAPLSLGPEAAQEERRERQAREREGRGGSWAGRGREEVGREEEERPGRGGKEREERETLAGLGPKEKRGLFLGFLFIKL